MRDVEFWDPDFFKPIGCPTCHDGELAKRLDEMSQLTGWLKSARLLDYRVTPGNNSAFTIIRDFLHNPNGMLTLWGANGLGKTHLLASLINRLTGERIGAVYYTLPDLLDVLREAVGADQYNSRIGRLFTVHVLAIDELDKARLTEWAEEKLYQLVDTRYRQIDHLGTLFAMNVNPAEMGLPYLYSRMLEGKIIQICGEDMRRTMAGMQ